MLTFIEPKKPFGPRNLPFVSKAKVQNFQKDATGGSKVFEMYTAQIKQRSKVQQNQPTNQQLSSNSSNLQIPMDSLHPVRRGSMNDILGQSK